MILIKNGKGIKKIQNNFSIWRWYLEEVIKCCSLENIKKFGLTLEEFSIVARCNGAFTEAFRPDENEIETEEKILENIKNLENKSELIKKKRIFENLYIDKNQILTHIPEINQDCKETNILPIKKADLDFFKVCLFSSVRRQKFFLVTNTSRKALKQTGDGHFSCITSYHEKSDFLLMLDSARFKYNSMWFNLKYVYNSFLPIDPITKKYRGFMLCSKYY